MKTPAPFRRFPRSATTLAAIACTLGLLLFLTYGRRALHVPHSAGRPAALGSRASELISESAANRVAVNGGQAARPLPGRPAAGVLYENLQRADIQPMFTRLGATETELRLITTGEFSALLAELRPGVERGDPRATAVFGWIGERCRLLRSAEQQSAWRQSNSARLQQLTTQDRAEYVEVAARLDAWEQGFRTACEAKVNQDEVDDRLMALASKEQDGASFWMLARREEKRTTSLGLMSAAAEAGFAQAQYEFALSLAADPQARQIAPDLPTAAALLSLAAQEVPEARAFLARCLIDGCDGAQRDPDLALEAARDAATEGQPDGVLFLGSRSAAALPPDEVLAWRLFKDTLAAQGCYGDEDAAFGLQSDSPSAPPPPPSDAARTLAESLWQRFGKQARERLGCLN